MKPTATAILTYLFIATATIRVSAQWFETTAPEGGTVNSFAWSSGRLYAGNNDGVFLSSDSGATWMALNEGLTDRRIWSVAVHNGMLFAGTNDSGAFRSWDDGYTWVRMKHGLGDRRIRALASDGMNLFAATLGGVFRSDDNGLSWRAVNQGLTNLFVRTLHCCEGRIWAGTLGGGIYFSSDSGSTWEQRNAGLENVNIMSIASTGSHLFAGTYGGLFLSLDEGLQWHQIDPTGANPMPRTGEKENPGSLSHEPKTVYTLAVRGRHVFIGMMENGVYFTDDGGQSWIPLNEGLSRLSLYSIFTSPFHLFVGKYGGGVGRYPLSGIISSIRLPGRAASRSIQLRPNYPNPFNPSTTITFEIPQLGGAMSALNNVRLTVYDPAGREVVQLLEGWRGPGTHSVQWDARGLPAGLYLCRLSAGSQVQSRKMLLVR